MNWIFFGPSAGAVVGSFGAWLVAKLAEDRRQKNADRVKDAENKKNKATLAAALIVELQTVKHMYELITDKCFDDMWTRLVSLNTYPSFRIDEDYLTMP